jgi:hypothetical protein
MTDPAMWSRAKMVAEYIVSDWMLLEADERTMSALVKEIEVELDKAFDDGMKAVAGFSQPLIRAAALEEAAVVAMDEETADFVSLLRHYAKLLGGEMPGVMNRAADMIEKIPLIRTDALEKAAKVAEDYTADPEEGIEIAAVIRALKEQP